MAFINVVNGIKIAEVFQKLGVPQVFTFSHYEAKPGVIEEEPREIMRIFSVQMIKRLIQEETFGAAFTESVKELENTIDRQKRVTVQWINGKDNNSGDRLFDHNNQFEDDEYIAIPDGQMENFSSRQELSNV